MLVSPVIAQPPPDLPGDYSENGGLEQPIQSGPYDIMLWEYDVSELGDCANDVKIWTFLTVDFGGDIGPQLVIYPLSAITGDFTVDAPFITALAGFPGYSFSVTHIAFQLEINGVLNSTIIYPGAGFDLSTGLPPPCDCIRVDVNTTSQKITLGPGNC